MKLLSARSLLVAVPSSHSWWVRLQVGYSITVECSILSYPVALFQHESSCNENEFDLHENEPVGGTQSFSYEWFHSPFATETEGNSVMEKAL